VGTVHPFCIADSAAGNAGTARRRSQGQTELKKLFTLPEAPESRLLIPSNSRPMERENFSLTHK